VRRRKTEDLLALRGKVAIDYDWEREEESELKATKNEYVMDNYFDEIPRLSLVKLWLLTN
jgi:hypothetical protein